MDYFKLMRDFWDWAFVNPEKITPAHCALFCFAVEHCNRLGWKEKFNLPTGMAMEALGIRTYKTYGRALNDLVDFGFIEMIERSRNQHSANKVALVNFTEPTTKALDRARLRHGAKQVQSSIESSIESESSINKPITIYHIPEKPIKAEPNKNDLIIQEVETNEEWLNIIAMQNRITSAVVLEWLKNFNTKLKGEMDVKYNKKDLCSHFARWLPGELKKKQAAAKIDYVSPNPKNII
jgi:hypothetical protein